MNVSIAALLSLFLAMAIIGYIYWYTMKRASRLSASFPFVKAKQRKLSPEDRQAIDTYLQSLASRDGQRQSGLHPLHPRLMPQGERVYAVTHAITRYALAGDTPSQHRYFLDNQEIHLPAFWEKYIADENSLELIKTAGLPLVITINGHSLCECLHNRQLPTPAQQAAVSIHRSEGDPVDLCGVRQETVAEYRLHQHNGIRPAIPAAIALFLLAVALTVPLPAMPWLLALNLPLLLWGIGCLYRRPQRKHFKEIHLLRGIPKRWGLFGESCGEQVSNVSVGTLDLVYPPHWQPYIHQDLGKPTDIEIYQNRQVVRQGRFLSLNDEVTQFPLQPWGRNALLGMAALAGLLLLLTTQSLSIPLKISTAWLHGTQTLTATSVAQLTTMPLQVGDILDLRGTGMCHVPPFYHEGARYPFMPFDCSTIYWGTASPMAEPSSDTIDNAAALQALVTRQLASKDNENRVSPALASAIEKSGMILLDDFSGIVLKTEALCAQKNECTRLKNALVNLGNSKSWAALLKKARNGGLNGINVLMRPASAHQLTNIVNSAVSSFYYRETHKAAQLLAVTPPGGFLISSDEDRQWVSHPQPSVSLYNYSPVDQWRELENLSRLLLNTPFRAHGVITEIRTDANGTRHIMLHSQPDGLSLWRYLLMTPLLPALAVILVVNVTLFIRRLRASMARIPAIQRYYEQSINHKIMPFDPPPRP